MTVGLPAGSLQRFAALDMLPGVTNATAPKGTELMRYRNLLVCTTVFTAALFTSITASAQAPAAAGAKPAAKKVDNTDPRTARFGVWDNSTNPNNVMTYEA